MTDQGYRHVWQPGTPAEALCGARPQEPMFPATVVVVRAGIPSPAGICRACWQVLQEG